MREGSLVNIARNILHAVFNHARTWLEEHDSAQEPGVRATSRIAQSPRSLTRGPIVSLVQATWEKRADPQYTIVPRQLTAEEQQDFLETLHERAETDQGLVLNVEMAELAQDQGIAAFDVQSGVLRVNNLHPFVAAYREDFEKGKDILILLAMAEVLTEAHLYDLGLEATTVREAMNRRDNLLRHFVRSATRRNANMQAQALLDAACDQDMLEEELATTFRCMGFDAVRIGGKGKPDGKAEAHLSASDGKERRYSVSLEAKSKEQPGRTVKAKEVDVAAVIQHRDEFQCGHAAVIGPDFPTSTGEESNLVKQARVNKEQTGQTITFIRIEELAKLVRIVALKSIDLDHLRRLFKECISPEDVSKWIDNLNNEISSKPPFRTILEAVWELQQKRPFEAVEFSAVTTRLQYGDEQLVLKKDELANLCKAMSMIAPKMVVVTDNAVELTQRPDKIMEAFEGALQTFPEDEQKRSIFKV